MSVLSFVLDRPTDRLGVSLASLVGFGLDEAGPQAMRAQAAFGLDGGLRVTLDGGLRGPEVTCASTRKSVILPRFGRR